MVGEPIVPGSGSSSNPKAGLGNFFAAFYDDFQARLNDLDNKTIENDALEILTFVVGSASLLSLLPFESNFGAYAAGSIIADAMRPFVQKIISEPAQVWLNRAFRVAPLPERTALLLFQEGIISDSDVTELAIENGFSDKWIPTLRRYAEYKQNSARLSLKTAADDANDAVLYFKTETLIARSEALAARLETELDALEENEATLIIQHQVSDLTSKHTRLEAAIRNFEFGSPATQQRALKEILSILVDVKP